MSVKKISRHQLRRLIREAHETADLESAWGGSGYSSKRPSTVGELRVAIAGLPDDLPLSGRHDNRMDGAELSLMVISEEVGELFDIRELRSLKEEGLDVWPVLAIGHD